MAVNILFISYDGLTDALGQSQILAYQKNISSEHFKITILSFDKKKNYERNKNLVQKTCSEAGITWQSIKYTKKPPVLSTIFDIYKGIKAINSVIKIIKPDLIHCRGYVPGLLGEYFKKKCGIPFIFDMRGWWPDEKEESGAWSSWIFAPVYHYFKKKEKDLFQNSAFTVSLTEKGKAEILNMKLKVETNVKVVPTCTNLNLFNRLPETSNLQEKQLLGFPSDSKILIYSGAIGGNYPASEIFVFLECFLKLSPKHFCLILSKEALPKDVKIPERTVMMSVEYNDVARYLSIGDFGLIYYKSSFSNIGRCPTKLGEYWACGLQVFSPSGIGDLDNLFQQYPNSGFTIPAWNEETINNVLQKAIKSSKDVEDLRNAAFDYFSLEKGVSFYKELYLNISQTKSNNL